MRESKKYSIFDILFYITWAISILTSFHFGHYQKGTVKNKKNYTEKYFFLLFLSIKDCLKPIDIEVYRKEKNAPMVVISGLPG